MNFTSTAYSRIWSAWTLGTTFFAAACILVIEILASRLLAPHVGVSFYTWTAIIGVVLTGISVGNYAGGYCADKLHQIKGRLYLLAVLLILAGVSSSMTLWQIEWVASSFGGIPTLVLRVALITFAVFLLPSVLLGAINPVVITLNARGFESSGNAVGSVFAMSTAGSLVGVFLTGFVLVDHFGVRAIIYGVSAAILFSGLLCLVCATIATLRTAPLFTPQVTRR